VLADGFLSEGGGLEDRHDDRTGHGLWLLPGVDRERFESGLTTTVGHRAQVCPAQRGRSG